MPAPLRYCPPTVPTDCVPRAEGALVRRAPVSDRRHPSCSCRVARALRRHASEHTLTGRFGRRSHTRVAGHTPWAVARRCRLPLLDGTTHPRPHTPARTDTAWSASRCIADAVGRNAIGAPDARGVQLSGDRHPARRIRPSRRRCRPRALRGSPRRPPARVRDRDNARPQRSTRQRRFPWPPPGEPSRRRPLGLRWPLRVLVAAR